MNLKITGDVWVNVFQALGLPPGTALAITRLRKTTAVCKLSATIPDVVTDSTLLRHNKVGIVPVTAVGCWVRAKEDTVLEVRVAMTSDMQSTNSYMLADDADLLGQTTPTALVDVARDRGVQGSAARQFRAAGGVVGCIYYGEWAHTGPIYNIWPWRYFKRFQDRVPLLAVPMPCNWKLVFKNNFYGSTQNAIISKSNNGVRLVSNGNGDVSWYSQELTTPTEDNIQVTLSHGKVTTTGTTTLLTDTAMTWGVNTLMRRKIKFLSGALAGNSYTIAGNSATTLTPETAFPSAPLAGDDYIILSYYEDYQIKGSDHLAVRALIVPNVVCSPANWEGKIYFVTTDNSTWESAKSVSFGQQPTFTAGQPFELVWDMSGNAAWTGGTIRKIRFDLWNDATTDYVLREFEIVATSHAKREENNKVLGGPTDQQWYVDWEIDSAYRYGVDFFIHNQYWGLATQWGYMDNHTDYSMQLMFNSTIQPNFKHCIQWSNHDTNNPFANLQAWYDLIDYWYSYFSRSNYYRIGGKPVLYIFSGGKLLTWAAALYSPLTGINAAKAMLDALQARIKSKPNTTCPDGVYIIGEGGVSNPYWNGSNGVWQSGWKIMGCSAVGCYNQFNVYTGQVVTDSGGTTTGFWPANGGLKTYDILREVYRRAMDWAVNRGNNTIPTFGAVIAGWDKRPWVCYNSPGLDYGANYDVSFNCNPLPRDFEQHCREQLDFVLKDLPRFNANQTPPTVMIYAWNEFGEGGYICPTRSRGNAMLDAVKDVFGR